MSWFKSQQEVDLTIQSSLYSGLKSEADGIDLRIEMNRILYGGPTTKPLGHWIVVRHFDRTTKSDNWNKYNKEAVGGPGFKYTDKLLRTRRITNKSQEDNYIKPSELSDNQYCYYIEYIENISVNDYIYELNLTDNKQQPTTYKLEERFRVKKVHPYRLENGNIQYYAVIVERDNVTY